jgi:uncharacterized protein (TIGR02300 family)
MAGEGHSVADQALGTKRVCGGCAKKFYDLGNDPIVCPTCETVFVIPKAAPSRGRGGFAPRSAYDPNSGPARSMGPAAVAAPAIAEAPEAKDDTEDAAEDETEDAVEDETEDAGGVPMLEEIDEK